MRIFVAYGYNDRDKWIREMVFPIIEAFGADVETGEDTFDGTISDIVRDKIEYCDALIAFTTKREPKNAKSTTTHQWVKDELAIARGFKKKLVEVRESGVDSQSGITDPNQRIDYDEKKRDECLVKVAQAIGTWHKSAPVQIQLYPEGLPTSEYGPLSEDGYCEYILRVGSYSAAPVQTQIVGITGGLFIIVPKPQRGSLVKVKLRHSGRSWSSYFEAVNSYGITLQ